MGGKNEESFNLCQYASFKYVFFFLAMRWSKVCDGLVKDKVIYGGNVREGERWV